MGMSKLNYASLSGFAFLLFFVFDNYIPEMGIRPFDFAGIAVVVGLAIFEIYRKAMKVAVSPGAILFAAVMGIYVLISLMFRPDQWKSHIGIILGLVVFVYYRSFGRTGGAEAKWVERILYISVAALFAQMVYYLASGEVIDLVLFSEGGLRVWYGGTIFRPTGLFLEPNSYCLATAMLVLLRRHVTAKPFDSLSYIAIGSMFISMSLWGGAVALLLITYDLLSRGVRVALLSVVFLIPGTILFGFILLQNLGALNSFRITMVDRAANIMMSFGGYSESDLESSYRDRYSALLRLADWDNFDYRLFIGNGVSTSDFQEYGGANALSFLIYSFGLIGTILVAFAIIASAKGGVERPLAIVISLSSYPLVTYFYWWAWLGLLTTGPAIDAQGRGILRTQPGRWIRRRWVRPVGDTTARL